MFQTDNMNIYAMTLTIIDFIIMIIGYEIIVYIAEDDMHNSLGFIMITFYILYEINKISYQLYDLNKFKNKN